MSAFVKFLNAFHGLANLGWPAVAGVLIWRADRIIQALHAWHIAWLKIISQSRRQA